MRHQHGVAAETGEQARGRHEQAEDHSDEDSGLQKDFLRDHKRDQARDQDQHCEDRHQNSGERDETEEQEDRQHHAEEQEQEEDEREERHEALNQVVAEGHIAGSRTSPHTWRGVRDSRQQVWSGPYSAWSTLVRGAAATTTSAGARSRIRKG